MFRNQLALYLTLWHGAILGYRILNFIGASYILGSTTCMHYGRLNKVRNMTSDALGQKLISAVYGIDSWAINLCYAVLLCCRSQLHSISCSYCAFPCSMMDIYLCGYCGHNFFLAAFLNLALLVRSSPWLMESGGSMSHSQGPSNNPYPQPDQPNSSY